MKLLFRNKDVIKERARITERKIVRKYTVRVRKTQLLRNVRIQNQHWIKAYRLKLK